MKKPVLLAALVFIASAASASAADLAPRPYVRPVPPPAPIAAIYNWSGFYISINGGGGGSPRQCFDFVRPPSNVVDHEDCFDATGGTIGGQIGYRWQASNWVFGLEGQGNWADFPRDHISFFHQDERLHSRIDAFGLITGQVGYAWNNLLLYVKGGAAVTGNKYELFDVPSGLLLASADGTRWGATVGAGLEFGFTPNWSVGVEYDHLFVSSRDISFPAGVFAGTDHFKQDVDMGLVRLNYRFGGWGGAPVTARY